MSECKHVFGVREGQLFVRSSRWTNRLFFSIPHFGWDFCGCLFLIQPLKQSHSIFMDSACWMRFVAGIHPSRTWMSGSFESMCWNACVHRLDFSLYSHPNVFLGNEFRTHDNSNGKIPSNGKTFLRGRSNPCCCIMQDSEPNTRPRELFRPWTHHCTDPFVTWIKRWQYVYSP